jgi:copper transport protein
MRVVRQPFGVFAPMVAAWAIGVLVALLVLPAAAHAHASLQASVPADGQVLEAAPNAVELRFSGTVAAGPDAIRVFSPAGDEVQVGGSAPARGMVLRQPIEASESGTYGVAYRVSSEDGHVINGSLTFSVGEASEGGGASASRDAASVATGLQLAFSITRFVEVAVLLGVAGGGIFACLLAPGWRPRMIVAGLVILLAAYAAGFALTSAILHGGLGSGLSGEALAATSATPFGRSTMLRGVVALVALGPAILLHARVPLPMQARWAMAAVFVGLAASLSISGHAVTTPPTWLRLPLDMVHVIAAAIWMGGLIQLAFLAPFASNWIGAVRRFSNVAFASVVVLLLTGVYATYAELGRSVPALLESTYGRLILAKLALFLGTIPLAWNNKDVFVPSLQGRPEDAPRMLRQYVLREFMLVAAIVALTVWLIATPQP